MPGIPPAGKDCRPAFSLKGGTNVDHLTILLSIIMINMVLSGDNAVVIALASRKLPPGQQKLAVFIGSAGAIVMRIILTAVIVMLLKIPFLQALGALLLIYIAVRLLREDDSGEEEDKAAESLVEAVKIIIFADLIMSLDNTLAIAAVSRGDWPMLVVGLATSIPIIIFCAQIILFLMKKFPVIIYIGAGILGWTAGEMLLEDKKVGVFLSGGLGSFSDIIHAAVPVAITAFVILYGWVSNRKQRQKARQTENSQSQ
ncbi:MAG: TerC family protein [Peptococcaceae bacterium]|nr:TerC family protein [Peptococcaceae bacterium]